MSALLRPIPKNGYVDGGTETVASANGEIVYALRRSRRRTVGISVHPDRSVVVRAPLRVSRETIRDFVRSHAEWIERTRLRLAASPPKAAPPGYGSGETHPFLGQPYRLVVSRGHADSVELLVGCLCVTAKAEPSPARVKALLEGWYREQAEVVFPERLAACHAAMNTAGIPYPALRIRKMTSRWGSCSTASGRINLNLWLVKAPVPCIDYVIIHELCHFKVRSHGPKFWKVVAGFLPDYADRRKRLNAGGG